MAPEVLQRDWLSLRCWLVRCVLPSALVLLLVLTLLKLTSNTERALDHKAVLVGFFALYYVLIRGGHMVMIRSLHTELLRKYETGYTERLAQIDTENMKRLNIGFTLARIKRELIDAQIANKAAKAKTFQR